MLNYRNKYHFFFLVNLRNYIFLVIMQLVYHIERATLMYQNSRKHTKKIKKNIHVCKCAQQQQQHTMKERKTAANHSTNYLVLGQINRFDALYSSRRAVAVYARTNRRIYAISLSLLNSYITKRSKMHVLYTIVYRNFLSIFFLYVITLVSGSLRSYVYRPRNSIIGCVCVYNYI